MNKENVFYATGKRKTAIARTWLKPGNGEIIVNDRPVNDYFKYESARTLAIQPFKITNTSGSYDVKIHVMGGGIAGQAGAVRHGITRALLQVNPDFRQVLKKPVSSNGIPEGKKERNTDREAHALVFNSQNDRITLFFACNEGTGEVPCSLFLKSCQSIRQSGRLRQSISTAACQHEPDPH